MTARERERHARSWLQAALAAALDALRRAQERFDESSAAIEAHIQQALAADAAAARLLGAAARPAPVTHPTTSFAPPRPAA
jgi:hypothetical protein